MVKASKKRIRILMIVAVVAAFAVGLFRAFLLVNYIEPETGFYISGTGMETLFNISIGVVVAIIALLGFMTRKNLSPDYLDSKSTVVVFTSALCAFMYISFFLYGLYSIVTVGGMSYFKIVEVMLCIPCCFNHISVCSNEVREKNTYHALLAMSEAVFFAVRVVEVFMDTKSQINVSQRSLELIMLCAMMIFFLVESRFLVKSELTEEKSLSKYFMAGVATVVFPLVAVIPYLAVSLFWCFESQFVVMDVLDCCVMLFAASRLLTLRFE